MQSASARLPTRHSELPSCKVKRYSRRLPLGVDVGFVDRPASFSYTGAEPQVVGLPISQLVPVHCAGTWEKLQAHTVHPSIHQG
jgi:hypothetical protein